ncbi:MAG: hypothetical protein ACOCRU_00910 [bacterium]
MNKEISERKDKLLEFISNANNKFRKNPSFRGVYFEIPKMELNQKENFKNNYDIEEKLIKRTLSHIKERKDCKDFVLPGILSILYSYKDQISVDLRKECEATVLDFMYWLDEDGIPNGCYFTENHQILYHSCEYLAAQLYPDKEFKKDHLIGKKKKEKAHKRILRWIRWRARFGFSEWNANGYFDEDLLALIMLYKYAEEKDIKDNVKKIIDLILFEIGINSFDGVFGSSHGRTYPRLVLLQEEPTAVISYLFWEKGSIEKAFSLSSIIFALSDYKPPEEIISIAQGSNECFENKERHSLDVESAPNYGLVPEDMDNIPFFWSSQVYNHRKVIASTINYSNSCFGKDYDFLSSKRFMKKYCELEEKGMPYDPDPDRTALTSINLYTYRTSYYMLSAAQDYRPGKQGYQQHIWQATLGGKAIVFTNHPGVFEWRGRPNYWIGNGIMPKVTAYRDFLIAQYNGSFYTHGFFPVEYFDSVEENKHWVFGQKGDAYIGLYSYHPTFWKTENIPSEDKIPGKHDLVALGRNNFWICQLGSKSRFGNFKNFIKELSNARVERKPNVLYEAPIKYNSPTDGEVSVGWMEPLIVDGKEIKIEEYPRMKNKYCSVFFDTTQYPIKYKGKKTVLNFQIDKQLIPEPYKNSN